MKKKSYTILSLLFFTVFLFSSTVSYAKENTVEAEPAHLPIKPMPVELNSFPSDVDSALLAVDDEVEFHFIQAPDQVPADSNNIIPRATTVAKMKIYAVNRNKVSSSSDGTVGHVFLVITNTSSSNISIGGLSGIKPNTSVSIGTWGNAYEGEHKKGLWYNLEGYSVQNTSDYNTNVTMQVSLTSSLLSTVNTNIKNGDSWSPTSNCSTFAVGVWNSVCTDKLSAGTPNTPDHTVDSIKSYTTKYTSNVSVPFDYVVYYGHPATKSTYYN